MNEPMDPIRTYRVRSLHEALQLIRAELGPDAAVLHTREVRSGWLGWRTELEVTASAEVEIPSRFVGMTAVDDWSDESTAAKWDAPPAGDSATHDVAEEDFLPPADRLDYRELFLKNLQNDAAGLDLSHPLGATSNRAFLAAATEQLTSLGLPLALLAEFNRQESFPDGDTWKRWLRSRLAAELNVVGASRVPRNRRTVLSVVGPTGVGKTTTLAKLAANFRLEQQRQVGLVTVDTYRVGAVDQLRAYAEIMDLPMEVVSTPREMRDALSRLHACDVVLIDTAGRSQRDSGQMQELRALLAAACPDEVHLVASTVAESESLGETLKRFREVGANRLILTKADEAARPGRLFSFLSSADLPLSYVTNGQNVPADIRAISSEHLADWLLDERVAAQL